jgi:squalene cyclase
MSYIYGLRCTHGGVAPVGGAPAAPSALALELREELLGAALAPGPGHDAAWAAIDWDGARNTVADIDLYAPHTRIMDLLLGAYRTYERYAPAWLREPLRARGAAFAIAYVHAEDEHTNFVDIGPVNKVVNLLAVFFEGGRDCEDFRRHLARVDDYLWVAEDGMKMQGYNGSQLWDTAFATQALAASGLAGLPRFREPVARIYSYLDATQVKEDVPRREQFFRTISKGGWPFSTSDHGW